MKKIRRYSFAFVAGLLMLTACGSDDTGTGTSGGDTADGDTVTLRYYTFSPGESHESDLQAMIEEFENQNENIKIEYEMASFDDYFTRLQTQIAGDNAPDTFELNYENFVSYANLGALMNLDELLSGDSEFDSSTLNQEAFNAFQYEGSQYGMVESFSNVVFYYNKALFDEAGLDYPDASWTWEDELEAAKAITNADEGVWGTWSPITFNEFFKVIAQNGGSIFNEDKTEVTINSPENLEALQYMVDRVYEYELMPSQAQMGGQSDGDLFTSGKLGMLRTGIWMFDSFSNADFDWDIALEPGNTEKAHHFFANGLAISANTDHPEEAWEWIKFMSASKEAAEIRVEASWELPAVSDDSLIESYLQEDPPASREVVFEALDTLVVPPVIEEWNRMSDAINSELELVALGQKDPADALSSIETQLQDLID